GGEPRYRRPRELLDASQVDRRAHHGGRLRKPTRARAPALATTAKASVAADPEKGPPARRLLPFFQTLLSRYIRRASDSPPRPRSVAWAAAAARLRLDRRRGRSGEPCSHRETRGHHGAPAAYPC